MCSGAIVHARLKEVIFILKTEKGPGLTWLEKNKNNKNSIHPNPFFNHYPKITQLKKYHTVFEKQLKDFFQLKRK